MMGQCVVGRCVGNACVYAPDSSRCNTDPDSCAVSTCKAATGQCVDPVLHDELCDDGFSCTDDVCSTSGPGGDARCTHAPVDSDCDDGVGCTINMCDPQDPTHDAQGCAMRLNDLDCGMSTVGTCVRSICLPNGCADAIAVDPCGAGQSCNFQTGYCESPIMCPEDCDDFGTPCAPAMCMDSMCVGPMVDPCATTLPCTMGYCAEIGPDSVCVTLPNPACLPPI